MDKEFVPYEPSLALKELGFDEPCLAHLIGFGDGTIENGKYDIKYQQVFYPHDNIKSDDKAEELGLYSFSICRVPLYQQAFRWFREKHNLNHSIIFHKHPFGTDDYQYLILLDEDEFVETGFKTYEEAELACLNKLIEIVKQQTHATTN